MTGHRRPVGGVVLAAVGAGVLAAALCLAGLVFSPVYATVGFGLIAVVTGAIAIVKAEMRGGPRGALAGVAGGIALALAFYWISALIHLE